MGPVLYTARKSIGMADTVSSDIHVAVSGTGPFEQHRHLDVSCVLHPISWSRCHPNLHTSLHTSNWRTTARPPSSAKSETHPRDCFSEMTAAAMLSHACSNNPIQPAVFRMTVSRFDQYAPHRRCKSIPSTYSILPFLSFPFPSLALVIVIVHSLTMRLFFSD